MAANAGAVASPIPARFATNSVEAELGLSLRFGQPKQVVLPSTMAHVQPCRS